MMAHHTKSDMSVFTHYVFLFVLGGRGYFSLTHGFPPYRGFCQRGFPERDVGSSPPTVGFSYAGLKFLFPTQLCVCCVGVSMYGGWPR